jgi:hypothetical protein
MTDSQKQTAISIAKGQSIAKLFAEKNPQSDLGRVLIAGYLLEKPKNTLLKGLKSGAPGDTQVGTRPPSDCHALGCP